MKSVCDVINPERLLFLRIGCDMVLVTNTGRCPCELTREQRSNDAELVSCTELGREHNVIDSVAIEPEQDRKSK